MTTIKQMLGRPLPVLAVALAIAAIAMSAGDGAGQVWHIENLKPGKYSVGYIIQAEKGEPSPYISYWIGEVRTPTVLVEIKE